MATTTNSDLKFPEVPNTPLRLFTDNDVIFRELGPTRYFVFAQYFVNSAMRTYLKEIITIIQEQRNVLGTKDCNYDVNQLRVLISTLYAFDHIIRLSDTPAIANTCVDAFLYMLNKSYWTIFKKYIKVEDRDDSQRYFSMLLARAKIEFNHDPEYNKFKGGRRNCTYKRGRKAPKTRRH